MLHRMGAALLALGFLSGCTDLVTIDIGRGRIAPIEVNRELDVGGGTLLGCPKIERSFAAEGAASASASLTPVTTGCRARLRLEDALLVNRANIERIGGMLAGFDRTALVGIDVEVDELALDGDGERLESDSTHELSVLLDEQIVLSAIEPESVPGRREALPESVVDAFFRAVDAEEALRVDLELQLTFREGARLPDTLRLHMLLQPILRVDVIRAAF